MNAVGRARALPVVLLALLIAVATPLWPDQRADPSATADSPDTDRARMNYMLNCQGCHGAEAQGSGVADVPRMKDFVGNFLKVPGGRAFLVQVPGSANASISDAQLAELLNWMLLEVSAAQLPTPFEPYTEAEIKSLRSAPEEDVFGTRAMLVEAISQLRDNP